LQKVLLPAGKQRKNSTHTKKGIKEVKGKGRHITKDKEYGGQIGGKHNNTTNQQKKGGVKEKKSGKENKRTKARTKEIFY